jgi:uncharacterized protein (UPF0248 family)
MLPLHDLLNRIRWDPEFGKGAFEIGYVDRFSKDEKRLKLHLELLKSKNQFSFQIELADGESITIPFHRVQTVYKDGAVFWQRPIKKHS